MANTAGSCAISFPEGGEIFRVGDTVLTILRNTIPNGHLWITCFSEAPYHVGGPLHILKSSDNDDEDSDQQIAIPFEISPRNFAMLNSAKGVYVESNDCQFFVTNGFDTVHTNEDGTLMKACNTSDFTVVQDPYRELASGTRAPQNVEARTTLVFEQRGPTEGPSLSTTATSIQPRIKQTSIEANDPPSPGLDSGAIGGIVVGVAMLVALISLASAYYLMRTRAAKRRKEEDSTVAPDGRNPYEKGELDGTGISRPMSPQEVSGEKETGEMAVTGHEKPAELGVEERFELPG